ncbi:MAG: hypothetical protein ACJ8AD_17585 [Gemmatimonadaceae bacterium]
MIRQPRSDQRSARRRALFAVAVIAACATMAMRGNDPGLAMNVPREAARVANDSSLASLWMEMRNVDLHIDADHAMHVWSLRGQVISTAPGTIASLDDPTSFRIRATNGTVALDGDGISALLNEIAFNYPGAPVKHLRVRIENGAIIQKGTLHKGVDIPFEMTSVPLLEPDGRLRLHPDKLRIFSVNGLVLMHALGLHLASMMDVSKARGVTVKGDDLYLEPLAIIPPPVVEGRLSAVRVTGNLLVQEFARTPDDTIFGTAVRADSGSKNFVYFRGSQLKFGKLTMTDTDLLIHDADEADPFDLYFAQYNKQLVAGHTKNLPNYGLRTWMVDYRKVGREPAVAAR